MISRSLSKAFSKATIFCMAALLFVSCCNNKTPLTGGGEKKLNRVLAELHCFPQVTALRRMLNQQHNHRTEPHALQLGTSNETHHRHHAIVPSRLPALQNRSTELLKRMRSGSTEERQLIKRLISSVLIRAF